MDLITPLLWTQLTNEDTYMTIISIEVNTNYSNLKLNKPEGVN